MKTTLTLLSFLWAFQVANAQWALVHSDPNKNLVDIQFVNDQVGYVAGFYNGQSSFLMKTVDGGDTWVEKPIPVPYLNKMCFITDSIGYVIKSGAPVRLFKTMNGGNSWFYHDLDSSYAVTGLAFTDQHTGFYMNNEGRFRGIQIDGASFTYISNSLPDSGPIDFTDPLHGFTPQSSGVLLTQDSGTSWSMIPTNLPDPIFSTAFSFVDSLRGYVSTRGANNTGAIYKTTDGAFSWQPINNFMAGTLHAKGDACIAMSDTGSIVWSADGGLNWANEALPLPYQGGETYVCEVTAAHNAFVIDGYGGHIYKRVAPLAVPSTAAQVFSIYPNPATTEVLLTLPTTNPFEVEIFNMLGSVVSKSRNQYQLDVSSLAGGMYWVWIRQDGKVYGQMLMK